LSTVVATLDRSFRLPLKYYRRTEYTDYIIFARLLQTNEKIAGRDFEQLPITETCKFRFCCQTCL